MKLIYINSNPWENKSADIIQSLNTVMSLKKIAHVIFLSSWVSNKLKNQCYKIFSIDKDIIQKRIPVKIIINNILLEKITRLLFCIIALLYIKTKKVKIVYTRDFSFLVFLSKLPLFFKKNLTIFFEAHKIYHKVSKKVTFKQERSALKKADLFVAISQGVKEDLINIFNISKEKILISPSGVNLSVFSKKTASKNHLNIYGINKKDKVVLYSGSFLEWKGVEYLIKAFEFIDYKNCKLLLVGGTGCDLSRIDKLVSTLNYKNMIKIVPMVSQTELINIMSLSDIAVLPNKISTIGEKYTSPIKLFEYLAMGLPIIASRLPSMTSILKEKENALFFEPENSKDLAKKIIKLLNDNKLRKVMSKNNVTKAKEYSWDKRAENILSFIKNNANY
jgi:glycosyltransferase involved in cell wall biosynthesis